MKKLLRYFIGSAADAPSAPPKKKAVTAHEVALRQAMARRRNEAAKDESAGETPSAVPERSVLARESMQKGEEGGKDGGGASRPLSRGKLRRELKVGHGLVDIAVVGAEKAKRKKKRKKSRQPDDVDAAVKSKKAKRKKSQQPDDTDAAVKSKRRKRVSGQR